jgi:hypothetical protein
MEQKDEVRRLDMDLTLPKITLKNKNICFNGPEENQATGQ